ncbi:hypothetical protein GP486_004383 [Trichoglossum hirsutum]|uniref:BTB domain-containing protein n=1 Tax=Trichoglossum hirsutum TaxID=265104 RepID=A0A9P8LBF8_9PEZI|nr:hypothetical protein GP486_004383 [Trichoglossum hirsutum]
MATKKRGMKKTMPRICCHCKCVFNNFAGCDRCGPAVESPDFVLDSVPSYGDGSIEFAVQFTSPTLCISVGPAKTKYYLNRETIISKSPYFKSLLSFNGTEATSGAVTLDSAADTDDAFQMLVEYIYLSDYSPPKLGRDRKCLLHAGVYVLAERLCMEDLKSLALEKMASELARAYTRVVIEKTSGWESPIRRTSGKQLESETVVRLVEFTYENTPSPYTELGYDRDSVRSVCSTHTGDGPSQEAPSKESAERDIPMLNHTEVDEALKPKRHDKMRVLIARYVASILSHVRCNEDFMAITRTRLEFTEDLIDSVLNGVHVVSDEWKKL